MSLTIRFQTDWRIQFEAGFEPRAWKAVVWDQGEGRTHWALQGRLLGFFFWYQWRRVRPY
jgi:hypothetical protein